MKYIKDEKPGFGEACRVLLHHLPADKKTRDLQANYRHWYIMTEYRSMQDRNEYAEMHPEDQWERIPLDEDA